MTRIHVVVLLLFLAAPIVGVCAAGSMAKELSAKGAGVQDLELTGYQVFNPAGGWLGEVAGVLANSETGAIEYLILSYRLPRVYGRALMVTNPHRFLAIPWRLFTPLPEEEKLVLDADEMTLIPAPYLRKSPESLTVELARVVDSYWQSIAGAGE